MALPLKSGADLYNQQAIRMRLHNLGADPAEVGKGLIYFNTNTDTNGSNHALHACVHDGTSFKALAYVDEIANNEDFLAVKRKVDAFFDGGVDADNVLENLAEVQKFLDNYSGATSLSQILDTKLDKAGGTIEGLLEIKRDISVIKFTEGSTICGYLGVHGKNNPIFMTADGTSHTLLTSAGGTIESAEYIPLILKRQSPYGVGISFENNSGTIGTIQVNNQKKLFFESDSSHEILHSGNVGDYALKYQGVSLPDNIKNGFGYNSDPSGYPHTGGFATFGNGIYGFQIMGYAGGAKLAARGLNNGTWTDWKQIAFTDSIVDKAKALVDASGNIVANYEGSTLYLGTTSPSFNTYLLGKEIRVRAGENSATAMLINSSGNVTIGASDLAGSAAKLYVEGNILLKSIAKIGAEYGNTKETYNYIEFNSSANGIRYYGGTWTSDDAAIAHQFVVSSSLRPALTMYNSGNVLIGKTTDNGKGKLQVEGDLYVTGNIIAEKNVSAKGKAKEAPASGGGGGLFYATTIAEGTKSTPIAHNLGTENVIVSIYEKSTMSGEVTWNMILTDVEIKGINSVQVTFGSETDVEHKVVIMGASAA